jgi:hypothetical protein
MISTLLPQRAGEGLPAARKAAADLPVALPQRVEDTAALREDVHQLPVALPQRVEETPTLLPQRVEQAAEGQRQQQ